MVALTDKLLPGPAAVEAVTGERPHYSTYFRWTQIGVKAGDGRRIKLRFVKAGSHRLTTVSAVSEFFAEMTAAASGGPFAAPAFNSQRQAAIAVAEREVDAPYT